MSRKQYGLTWGESEDDPLQIEMFFIQNGGYYFEGPIRYGFGKYFHYRQMMSLLWPTDDHHRWSDLILKRKCQHDILVLMGPADCVTGDTQIYNPMGGKSWTIAEHYRFGSAPTVMTALGPVKAEVPFIKGMRKIYEVTCANGRKFRASAEHLVLTSTGFSPVSKLRISQLLIASCADHPPSTLGICQQVPSANAQNCSERVRGSVVDCPAYYDSCGERLRPSSGIGRDASPSLNDVQRRKYRRHLGAGDRANKLARSQPYEGAYRLSILDSNFRAALWGIPPELLHVLGNCAHVGVQSQRREQFVSKSYLREGGETKGRDSFHKQASSNLAFQESWVQPTQITSIKYVGEDLVYDMTVPAAHHYLANGFIHHNSNKTYASARYVLCDYWAFPDNTLWMFSTTEERGAELRLWGKMKELWNRARIHYPWLPGRVLDSRTCITTEELNPDDNQARTLTKGIVFIPCKSGENWVGLGAYAGIKPPKDGRLGHFGDEVSYMERSLLQAYANWFGKPNFQGILTGNPTEIDDPLCTAAMPVEGWEDWHDTKKTQEWTSRWYGAHVIAFDGRDSPNRDYPANLPPRYPYMITAKKMAAVALAEGETSAIYFMQCVGKPIPGQAALRVFTVAECVEANAFDPVIWEGGPFMHILGLDAAYSGEGGDRCEIIYIKCGKGVGGRNIIEAHKPEIVPVDVTKAEPADIQIAKWVKRYGEKLGVPPENLGFDGRATLALAFAAVWSPQVVAIDFNAQATDRPVSLQHFIEEETDGHRARRPKRCNEHYRKFVTELWFTIHYLLRGSQIRGLPRSIAEEGSRRRWKPVAGGLMELETKKDMKARTKQSPDETDAFVTAIELARRRGFVIDVETVSVAKEDDDWLQKASDEWRRTVKSTEIKYS